MSVRILGLAALLSGLCTLPSLAQSVASVGAPAELPPAGYAGQQYVDSRGCVYLKAGFSGQVTWVLRVDRARKPMCGFPPSLGPGPVIETAEAPAAAAAPAAVTTAPAPAAPASGGTKPMATIAGDVDALPAPSAAPGLAAPRAALAAAPAAAAPAAAYQIAVSSRVPAGKIGCYTSAPKAERVLLRNGGSAVVCTRGDGTLTGWRPPLYPEGSAPGVAISDEPVALWGRTRLAGTAAPQTGSQGATAAAAAPSADQGLPPPPKGFVHAWTDGRLNPNRAKGTAAGWAAQDQVWTRSTPAKAAGVARTAAAAVPGQAGAPSSSLSTKGQPQAGASYIVAGSFSVPANADRAARQIAGLGLPVASSQINRKGKALLVIMAGPFASVSEAAAGLSAVRGLGFADAFVR